MLIPNGVLYYPTFTSPEDICIDKRSAVESKANSSFLIIYLTFNIFELFKLCFSICLNS